LIRLEVEGGFLNGLDLAFADGLNVLIGARGSGKTSVIEVLRYCLGVRAVTDSAQRRATEQALWVLGDGCATLTIEIDGVERVLRRGVNQEPETAVPGQGVLFVSQKEIEAIGLDAESRRRILDDFATSGEPEVQSQEPVARVETVARQLYAQRFELDDVIEQLGQLAEVPAELERVEKEQAGTTTQSAELGNLQKEASVVSDAIGDLAELVDSYATAATRTERWRQDIESARRAAPDLARLPRDTATELRETLTSVERGIDKALTELAGVVESIDSKHKDADLRLGAKRRELADLNARIGALEEGAGRLSRTVSALREQEKRRQSLEKRRGELEQRVSGLVEMRAQALGELAGITNARYERRRAAAEALNGQFEGEIKVDVVKAGEVSDYESVLEHALQGSGLQRHDLARQLAARMSPRELVAAVEALDTAAVVEAGGVSENRARRLVSHLAGSDLTEILLSGVEEEVDFSLLDGQEFKATRRLSLGQRCTVVLPLLLAQDPDLAVLDQPEDHLDNAFVVDTVVDVLRGRRLGAQRVIATHNANIPVLGGADRVIVLGSSGRQAFIAQEGPLNEPEVVAAITRLMEGGAEAFRKRAEFYGP
jgi:ABC-type branched-subunit amino acid transport system ATPase component/predicted  nucleic acid-binding Zn-ribbon protein